MPDSLSLINRKHVEIDLVLKNLLIFDWLEREVVVVLVNLSVGDGDGIFVVLSCNGLMVDGLGNWSTEATPASLRRNELTGATRSCTIVS